MSSDATDAAPSSPSLGGLRLRRTGASLERGEGRLGWAPILAALALDLADLATAGPIGLTAGLFVGAVATALIAWACGAPRARIALFAALGALYCALPLTEVLPLATLLTAAYAGMRRRAPAQDSEPSPSAERARASAT